MLTPQMCRKFVDETENYEKSGLPIDRPNSMNNYGVVLDSIGFRGLMQELMEKYITPFSRFLFAAWNGDKLSSHHAFVVRYKLGEDLELSTHVDDSDVTLNVCLGKEFTGGSLFFHGIKGTPSEGIENFEYVHTPGKAILHVGKHIHGAYKLTTGERINLIVWCRARKMD